MNSDTQSQSSSTSSDSSHESTTTFTFTASQVAYMKQELEEYRNLTGIGAKGKLVDGVAAALLQELHELSGIKPSGRRKAELEEAVSQWFEDNGKDDTRKPKRVWASRWNARLVFNSLHTGIVKYIAKLIFHGKPIPDLRYIYDNELDFLENGDQCGEEGGQGSRNAGLDEGGDGDVEDEGIAGSPKKKGRKGKGKAKQSSTTETGNYFVRYQDAITLFWAVLTPEEIQKYEDLCAQWREIGPPRSEQRKAASKHLNTRLYDFAEAALRDCGAVIHFLVGFEDADCVRRVYDVECKVGPPDVPDFQTAAREVMQKSGLSLMWGKHVDRTLNSLFGEQGQESEETPKPRRQFGKPIIAMELDDEGYPILPPLHSKPGHMQHQEWLTSLLRSFFARHWAIAKTGKTLPPTTCRAASVQWKGVRTLWSECVDEEIMSEEMKTLFMEPSDASLDIKEALYNALYSRQQDPNVSPTFAFKAIPVKVRGKWESRPIARRVEPGISSPAAGPSRPLAAPKRKNPKKKGQKKQVSFEQTIPLKEKRPGTSTRTRTTASKDSSTATSSEASQSSSTTTSPEASASSSTTTPAESSQSDSSTVTSSENSQSDSSTTTSSENSSASTSASTSTRSRDSQTNRSSTDTSSEEHISADPEQSRSSSRLDRKRISFPTLKDLEVPLPPPASSSSDDEGLLGLIRAPAPASRDATGPEASRAKRRRMEVPPVDEDALKTPRLTRAERAKLEAETRVSTRSGGRGGNERSSGSTSRGGGARGGTRGKKRGGRR